MVKIVTFIFSYKKEKILLVETIFDKTLTFHKQIFSKNENVWFKTSQLADDVKLMIFYNLYLTFGMFLTYKYFKNSTFWALWISLCEHSNILTSSKRGRLLSQKLILMVINYLRGLLISFLSLKNTLILFQVVQKCWV